MSLISIGEEAMFAQIASSLSSPASRPPLRAVDDSAQAPVETAEPTTLDLLLAGVTELLAPRLTAARLPILASIWLFSALGALGLVHGTAATSLCALSFLGATVGIVADSIDLSQLRTIRRQTFGPPTSS